MLSNAVQCCCYPQPCQKSSDAFPSSYKAAADAPKLHGRRHGVARLPQPRTRQDAYTLRPRGGLLFWRDDVDANSPLSVFRIAVGCHRQDSSFCVPFQHALVILLCTSCHRLLFSLNKWSRPGGDVVASSWPSDPRARAKSNRACISNEFLPRSRLTSVFKHGSTAILPQETASSRPIRRSASFCTYIPPLSAQSMRLFNRSSSKRLHNHDLHSCRRLNKVAALIGH
ncbi:hypothetical protein IWZ01DRAFT_319855 [Phyllosticta capitalensis]